MQCEGREVTTIEGVGASTDMHVLQRAFVEHDGFQCGYCTPGQICSAIGMAEELKRGVPSAVTANFADEAIDFTVEEIRERNERQPVPLRQLQRHCRCGSRDLRRGAGAMRAFSFQRAEDAAMAIRLAAEPGAKYLGGGTNLVDLMRENIETPQALIDINGLSRAIEDRDDGSILIGAAAKNSALASHRGVRERFPVLAQAIVSGASGQIRNMATVGGNLLQRTRCLYFYDGAARCNKREADAGRDAIDGHSHNHAILGASPQCAATHPSDMCVALAALDAVVHLDGPDGARAIPIVDFHRLPGDTLAIETSLRPRELITAVELPAKPFAVRSRYRKVRERASYAFALVSVAAAIDIDNDLILNARLALGGVAHKPWRAGSAEQMLIGMPAGGASFQRAAAVALDEAAPLAHNGFKVELAQRVIVAVLTDLANMEKRP